MKFKNWTIDTLIEYLKRMKYAPAERLDPCCVPRVRGEFFVENGEVIRHPEEVKDDA